MKTNPKVIKQTTIVLNETINRPKERKPLDIWCDGENHSAMVNMGDHYEFAGSKKCDCRFKIKNLLLEKEIHCCLVCDNICAFSALEEGLAVIFHVCFNCITLFG